jgi:hypothetical protein
MHTGSSRQTYNTLGGLSYLSSLSPTYAPFDRLAAQAVKFGLPNMRTLGQQYAVCDNGGSVGMNAKYPDTMIGFQVHAAGGRNWLEGKGFNIFVTFTDTKQGSYPIVYAAILGPR